MPTRTELRVAGKRICVSNLDKLLFPAAGFTKAALIDYYARVAKVLLPHLRNRPLTLKRYPDGVQGEHFYEKNAPSHTPAWVKLFGVPRHRGEEKICYILLNDLQTLVWSANLANIELHTFLAKVPHLERPTMLVFDLDPGEGNNILDCARIAIIIRDKLRALGIDCLPKVSGSLGLHLHVPLNKPNVTYAQTSQFAKTLALQLEKEQPDRVVARMSKELRQGKIFIDWSQNSEHKTTIAPYSIRAKAERPRVAVPVTWEELADACQANRPEQLEFEPDDIFRRLEAMGDIFEPLLKMKQRLPPESLLTGSQDQLSEYRAKRHFSKTPEPDSPQQTRPDSNFYVIQKHAASRLHFDLRLEMEGALKSWAVPKGIPLKPGEPHLAIHVEDHPLEYGGFEGTIPEPEYGAGTVMVWDRGHYDVQGDSAPDAYHSGKIGLRFHGAKLAGDWVLLKAESSGPNHWLILKTGESAANPKAEARSVLSGRTMKEIAKDKQSVRSISNSLAKELAQLSKKEPDYVRPMQCTAVEELPEKGDWIFEVKFDGYRTEAIKKGDSVRLVSRNGKDLTGRFPEVAETVRSLSFTELVLDGEIVALDPQGHPSFQALQNKKPEAVVFYAFDLLNLNSHTLLPWPLRKRKELLARVLAGQEGALRLCANLPGKPGQISDEIRKLDLEGVVAKRSDSRYEPGKRSDSWLKYKTANEQEFVVGGYVPGTHGFESLLVGVYEHDSLLFVGKVLNGFTPALRSPIARLFPELEARRCPFANLPEKRKGGEGLTAEQMRRCRWLRPELVVRVAFREWTAAGLLRHPFFIALREDKSPEEVVREQKQ